MRISFKQKYLQEVFIKIFTGTFIVTCFYHLLLWIISISSIANNYNTNLYVNLIKTIGFYLSIIPIKIFSVTFPNLYTLYGETNLPISKDGWVFVLEQALVILFLTLTFFSIYIMLMWTKRIYKAITKRDGAKWSALSISLGVFTSIYYILFIIITSLVLKSFK